MTVVDMKARARRLDVDLDAFRRGSVRLNSLIAEAMRNQQDDHFFVLAKKLDPDELVAIIRYREYDKKYPEIFNRNGFVED